MKKHEKYIETLKTFIDYVTITEWAVKFVEIYPDEINQTEDSKKIAIRKLVKNITSLVSTGKWSNILLIDKNNKPKKVKYRTNEQKEDNIHKNILISQSTKDVKSINFELLMKNLENLPDDSDLPHRDDPKYCGSNQIKGIEQLDIFQFNACMIFEMATRNEDVIEIINKLNFIDELQNKYPYLESGAFILFKPIDPVFDAELNLPMLTEELKEEYEAIAEMSISTFQEQLNSLVDTEYSDYYNNKPRDSHKKNIDNKYLTDCKLMIIVEYLENKLRDEYFIFPNDYEKNNEQKCHEKVINKDSIDKSIFHNKNITETIADVAKNFRTLKPTHMEQVADIFFMYDYFYQRKTDNNLAFYAQDLKFELTRYHGIEIEGLEGKFTYDECLDRYEEFKNLEAKFYTTEKTITHKIELMDKFINKKLYKFILFH